MSDNVNIIVQDTINEIVVNSAVIVETIDINVQVAVDEVTIITNPNEYIINVNRIIGEQVQSDWNETDNQAPDYIKNKPIIPSISGLATVVYVDQQDALKVDKIAGKGLSTNDYTTVEQTKLAGIQDGAEVNVNADWNATSGDAEILNKPTIPSISGLATVTYVDQQDALKVDKVTGYSLTKNDFTDTLKTKLDGIQDGAEVNVNADWDATSGDAQILNKPTIPTQGLTSVGLSMPVAFNVANSPLTSDGTIAVSAAGTSSQYIRGDGQLATLPSSGGGGASVFYYLNGSIDASVATYKQLSNTAVIGAGTDFAITGNGLITQFLTDVGNPNRLQIPSGAWNFEMFFSMSSSGGTPKFYVELLKYNGATFTTIANNSAAPETISGGTSIDLYLSSLAVPETTLLLTDRLAIRVYIVNNSGGRTATLHTEDNHLCQITTTFASGISAINGLNSNNQYLSVGTSGTNFNINSVSETHTFNLPTASATNRGALSTTDWSAFNGKFNLPSLTSGSVLFSNGTTIEQDNAQFFWNNTNKRLGIGTTAPLSKLDVKTTNAVTASRGNLYVRTSDVQAIDKGGQITLGGMYDDAGTFDLPFGAIAGRKINGTNNSLSGYLQLSTSDSSGTLLERMRITATGLVGIGTPAPAYPLDVAGNVYLRNSVYIGTRIQGYNGSVFTNLILNDLGNNVGIGTTTPTAKLHVAAPGALSTDIALRVRNSADTADLLVTNGLGNVGIGTATPAQKLEVVGNAIFRSTSRIDINPGQVATVGLSAGTAIGVNSNFTIFSSSSLAGETMSVSYWNGTIYCPAVRVANVASGFGNLLLMKDGGNVGIGTTAPTAKLHIAAPGALSTDIALRVRNSADSGDLMTVNGLGDAVANGNILGANLKQNSGLNNLTIGIAANASLNNVYALNVGHNAGGGQNIGRSYSTAIGSNAGLTATDNSTYIGAYSGALASGTGMVTIGRQAGYYETGNNKLFIDNDKRLNQSDAREKSLIYGQFDALVSNQFLTINGKLNVNLDVLIGTVTAVPSSKLTIESTTQGFLPPRMTNAQRIAIATPAVGLCVYCTDATEGLYVNKSTGWVMLL